MQSNIFFIIHSLFVVLENSNASFCFFVCAPKKKKDKQQDGIVLPFQKEAMSRHSKKVEPFATKIRFFFFKTGPREKACVLGMAQRMNGYLLR